MPLTVREHELHDHLAVNERKAHARPGHVVRIQAAARERRLQRLVIRNVCAGARSADGFDAGKRHLVGRRKNIQVVDRQADQLAAGQILHLGADLPDQHCLAGADAHGRSIRLQRGIVLEHLRENRRLHAAVRLGAFHSVRQPVAQARIAPARLDRYKDRIFVRRDIAVRLHIGDDRVRRRLQGLVAQLQTVEHKLCVRIASAGGHDAAELIDRQLNAGVGIERSDAAGHLRSIQPAAEDDQEKHCRCGDPAPPGAAALALRHRDDFFFLRLLRRRLDARKDAAPAIRRFGGDLSPQPFQQFLIGQDRHLPSNCAALPARGYSVKWRLPAGYPAGRQFLCA